MDRHDPEGGGQATSALAPPSLRAYQRGVTLICRGAYALAAVLVLVDLVLLAMSVGARYLLNAPITWGDELVALSLTAITMLAAPQVLLEKGHIGVDIVTGQAKGRLAIVIQLWSAVAVALVALLLIVNGWVLAMFSRMIGLLTEGHLELPLWMLQLLLPLGGLLLLPVVILQFWQAALAWKNPEADVEHSTVMLD